MAITLTDVTDFLKALPAGSYAGVVSTALAVERVFVAYAKKDWHPSLKALRTSLAAFIAPKTEAVTVTVAPTDPIAAVAPTPPTAP